MFAETEESKKVSCEVDRIYINPDSTIKLSTKLHGTYMELIKRAFIQPTLLEEVSNSVDVENVACDVVFWNPWIEKSLALNDLDNDAYLHFVCVEPGTVNEWVELESGKSLVVMQTLNACH